MEYGILAITDDVMAEDAINDVRTEQAERDRLLACCDAEIEKYEQRKIAINAECEKKTNWIVVMLGEYCRQRAVKATKTTQAYKLPSGTLKWLRKAPKVVRDEDKLLAWAKINLPKFVLKKETAQWEEIKKVVELCEETHIQSDENGEMVTDSEGNPVTYNIQVYIYKTESGVPIGVEGVTLEPQEDVFEIK